MGLPSLLPYPEEIHLQIEKRIGPVLVKTGPIRFFCLCTFIEVSFRISMVQVCDLDLL